MVRADDGRTTGVLEEDPITAATVRRIFSLSSEAKGVRTIADTLNREGEESPSGSHWWPGAISRILADKAYVGVFSYGARRGQGRTEDAIEVAIPPIIPTGLFTAVQRGKSKRSKGFGKRRHTYSLSGILSCEICQRPMGGTSITSGHGKLLEKPRRYYRCAADKDSRRPNCRTKSHQPAADIEGVVWDAVTQMLANPYSFRDFILGDSPAEDDGGLEAEIADAERALKALDLEDERLLTAYVKGLFKAEHLESAKSGIDARRQAARAYLEGLDGRLAMRVDQSTVELSVRAIRDGMFGDFDLLDSAGRKGLVQQVVESVELSPSGHLRIVFNFQKIESEAELAALRVAPRHAQLDMQSPSL